MAFTFHGIRLPLLILVLLLFNNCYGLFEDSKELETKEILLNYGAAHDSFSLVFLPDTKSESVVSAEFLGYKKDILTNVEIRTTLTGSSELSGATNVTCELNFEGGVGVTEYSIVIKTVEKKSSAKKSYSMKGKYVVVGMVLYSDHGEIVSGERSNGLHFSSYEEVLTKGPKPLKMVLQKPMRMSGDFDFSKIKIHVNPFKGNQESGVVDLSSFSMDHGNLEVMPKPYRVSNTPQIVTLLYPDFQVDGEAFETVLMVSVPNTKTPPPVVTGPGSINLTRGAATEFGVGFFNLMSPPQRKSVKTVSITAENGKDRFVVSTEPYKQTKSSGGLEETVLFKSKALNFTGKYAVKMVAIFEDGSSVPCHMEKNVQLSIGRSATVSGQAGDSHSAKSPTSLSGRSSITLPLAILAGIAGFAVVLTIIFALIRYRRNREAEVMESSFSRSGPIGVPTEYGNCGGEFVLRDTYARTGSSHSEIVPPRPEEENENEMQRTQSQTSSHVSF